MPIESDEPITVPAATYDKWWAIAVSALTIRLGDPTQSLSLKVIWAPYRILQDGSYDFHPTIRKRTDITDVYELAGIRPSSGVAIGTLVAELEAIAKERGDIK